MSTKELKTTITPINNTVIPPIYLDPNYNNGNSMNPGYNTNMNQNYPNNGYNPNMQQSQQPQYQVPPQYNSYHPQNNAYNPYR